MHTERYIDPKTEKVNCNRFLGKPCVNLTNFLLLLFLSFDCTYKAIKQVNYKREEKQKKDGVFKNHCVVLSRLGCETVVLVSLRHLSSSNLNYFLTVMHLGNLD